MAIFVFGDPLSPTPRSNGPKTAPPVTPAVVANAADAVPENAASVIEPGLSQTLVDDDGNRLWESPTSGPPLDVRGLPAAPDFLLSVRPQSMLDDEQAARFLQAMGPDFAKVQESWLDRFPVSLADVAQIQISLHSNADHRYEALVVLDLEQPEQQDQLLDRLLPSESWVDPESGLTIYQQHGICYYFRPMENSALDQTGEAEHNTPIPPEVGKSAPAVNNPNPSVSRIYAGPRELVLRSATTVNLQSIAGVMSKLVQASDRHRDINFLLLPKALLSEEAESFFEGPFQHWRRAVNLFFADGVQAAAISLHFDEGNYAELQLQSTVTIPAQERAENLWEKLRQTRDQMITHVAKQSTIPYWQNLQARFDRMAIEWIRETRVGVEYKQVLANCWLPPMAFHNLAAIAELSALAAHQAPATSTAKVSAPASLDLLLAAKRNLQVTSQPDLVNLLDSLSEDIANDFSTLPFEFNIKILGNDLRIQGITQNQRLGNLDFVDRSLADILTEIVFQANPDKNAESPKDPRCKLIWLVGADPDNLDHQIILITTRSAAQSQGWQIPKAFHSE